jgi:hypothetical protein
MGWYFNPFTRKLDYTVAGTGYVNKSGTPVQYDYARFTDADTVEGRSYSEVLGDLSGEALAAFDFNGQDIENAGDIYLNAGAQSVVYGGDATGDDLILRANSVDAKDYFAAYGDAGLLLNFSTGNGITFVGNDTSEYEFTAASADFKGNDITNAGSIDAKSVVIDGGQTVKRTATGAADYNPSALTTDYIIAVDNTTAARAVTISTEDEDSGSTSKPRVFVIKDESGGAAGNNITVSLESGGTIDGAASYVLDQPYQSITLYLNGTNGFII